MKRLLSGSFFAGLLAGLVIAGVVLTGVLLFVLSDQHSDGATVRDVRTTGLGKPDSESPRMSASDSSINVHGLEDLDEFGSRFATTHALHNLLFNMNKKDLKDLLRQSLSMKSSELKNEVQALVIQRMAMLSPEEALAEINKFPNMRRRELIGSVFLEWAASELDNSVKRAQSLDRLDRREAVRGILAARDDFSVEQSRSLARKLGDEQLAIDVIARRQTSDLIKNPEESWRNVVTRMESADGESSTAIRNLALHVAMAWMEQRGKDALYAINESVFNQSDRQFIIGRLLEELSQGDDSLALDLALEITPDDSSIVYSAIRRWASADPRAALEATSRIQSQQLRRGSQRVAIIAWADASPTELLKSLKSLDLIRVELKAFGQQRALVVLAETSARTAADYLKEVESTRNKRHVAQAIVASWIISDRNAALDWIQSESKLEDMRYSLFEVAVRNLARKSPQQALEIAKDHSEFDLEAKVIDEVTRFDVDEAISMLSSVRNEKTLKDSYQSIGTRLLTHGKSDRLLELISGQPEAFRSQVLNRLAHTWAFNEPADLVKRLDALPNDEVKRNAAMALRAANSLSKVLNDEQLAELERITPDISVGTTNEIDLHEFFSD